MSEYREWDETDYMQFEDITVIEKLCKSKKLTERERAALAKLYKAYNNMIE